MTIHYPAMLDGIWEYCGSEFREHAPLVICTLANAGERVTYWAVISGLKYGKWSLDGLAVALKEASEGPSRLFSADEHILTGGTIRFSPGVDRVGFVDCIAREAIEADFILDGDLMTLNMGFVIRSPDGEPAVEQRPYGPFRRAAVS